MYQELARELAGKTGVDAVEDLLVEAVRRPDDQVAAVAPQVGACMPAGHPLRLHRLASEHDPLAIPAVDKDAREGAEQQVVSVVGHGRFPLVAGNARREIAN